MKTSDGEEVATNHLGWEVQYYREEIGWLPLSITFSTKEKAEEYKESLIPWASRELRVYESLKEDDE